MKIYFGKDFYILLEDIEKKLSFDEMVLKYLGNPCVTYRKSTYWDRKNYITTLVIKTSMWAYSVYKAYHKINKIPDNYTNDDEKCWNL